MFQDRDKSKTASRRPHTCQTNHTHTVPRRKRPIYFWLLLYNKVYISERKTATASSLLECLTRAKPHKPVTRRERPNLFWLFCKYKLQSIFQRGKQLQLLECLTRAKPVTATKRIQNTKSQYYTIIFSRQNLGIKSLLVFV